MRKLRLFFSVLLSLIAWTGVMAQTGSQADPFVVKSADDLNNLHKLLVAGQMNYVVMENDIDMATVTDWQPLHNYSNVTEEFKYPYIDFDGKGHVISNLTSNTDGAYDYCGLFGVLCGNVRNLGVKDANVTCTGGTGIIAGYLGHDQYGKPCYVENVWVTGKLSASGYCGGMFGNIAGESHITNCYANVEVNGASDLTGGIIGRVREKVIMTNVYAAGSINQGGGIIGGGFKDATALGTYKNVAVWNNTAKNFGPTREGEELNSILYYDGSNFAEMQKQVVAWDSKVWYCDMEKDSYPVLVDFLDSDTKLNLQYEAALASITTDGVYYVKAKGFYLKGDGTLTTSKEDATPYLFQKVPGSFKQYGFLLNNNESFFSNPPGTNKDNLKSGKISTSTRGDYQYEAQVFFLKEGKYAVRAGNTPVATSGWAWVAGSYWTVVAEANPAVAQYQWEPDYIWELEYDELKTKQSAAYKIQQNWPLKIQKASGIVKDAVAQYYSNAKETLEGTYEALLDGEYSTFFHSSWSAGPDEDHYLQAILEEPVQKYQFYYKKRHNNNDNRPTKIIISASNDGKEFTEIKTINEGLPVDATVLDYVSDVIDLGNAYKYVRYTITETNSPNKKCNGHANFTFSEFYMLPEDPAFEAAFAFYKKGISKYELTEEDIASINKIEEDLNNALVYVTYQVKYNDAIVATSTAQLSAGSKPVLPEEFKIDYVTLSDPDISVITKTDNVVTYTATWNPPFQVSTSEADAKWYNMTIRSDYSVFVGATEPYYPKASTNVQKIADEYQWAFAGNPYAVVVFNKAKGNKFTLTKDGNNAVMREGLYAWTIGKNGDGFTLKETGTAYNCINQNGGNTGPLSFWNSGNAPKDNGSTFRISAVPTSIEWTVGEAGYATMYVPGNVNVVGDTSLPKAVGAWTFNDPNNLLAGTGVAKLTPTKEYPLLDAKKTIADAADLADVSITAAAGPSDGNGAISIPKGAGLKMTTNLEATSLETYTFMTDIKLADVNSFTSLIQTNTKNENDGDIFVNEGKIGVNGYGLGYNGTIVADTWYRIIVAVENNNPTIYINGEKVSAATSGDARFAVDDLAYFFADNDGEETDVIASELRFWDVALTADQAAKLGVAGTNVPEPTGAIAYMGKVTDESLKLYEVGDVVPAGTPVVIKAAPGTYTFAVDNSMLNVAQACVLTNALEDKASTEESYSVVGYITNLFGKPNNKGQQSFYIADTPDGGKDFEAYLTKLPEGVETFVVGQKVKITGKLYKYVSAKGVVTLEISNPDVVIIENDLIGTYEEIDAVGKYVLAKPEGKWAGFYKAKGGKIAANKAFLEIREGSEIKAFYFDAPENETAIENIAVEKDAKVSEGIYNLSGQRVNKAQKGIYIVNGKKVLF
jgi:hypothetical protein